MTYLDLALALIFLALILFRLASRERKKIGIPAGDLFYQDLAALPFRGQPLRSHTLGLSGKPDGLIRTSEGIVPVELKNTDRPPARGGVFPNHMIQALAYCALVEEQMNVTVPYALVIYAGQQARVVEFTAARRQWLLETIDAVEAARAPMSANRNHSQPGRCAGCGFRPRCSQALL
jgi:CRISPR/Cas system-associated exonuclease Cas4 (RecB family)